jgi:malate dehydrogenase (oxaloacetate-decarboxylating)
VLIAFSRPGPDVIAPEWIRSMAPDAVVITGANPVPEIYSADAHAAGARIVGIGRSGFPNQVNNALAFPGIFRGVFDVRARRITDGMTISAAWELARCAEIRGVQEDHILLTLDEPEIATRLAAVTGLAAQEIDVAQNTLNAETLATQAKRATKAAQAMGACVENL